MIYAKALNSLSCAAVCDDSPCLNGGICRDQPTVTNVLSNGTAVNFICECPSSFEGEFCELAVVNCSSSNPCRNGGSCEVRLNNRYEKWLKWNGGILRCGGEVTI